MDYEKLYKLFDTLSDEDYPYNFRKLFMVM